MKILLNTLYVTTPEAYLSKEGTNVIVSVKSETLFRIPISNIESICTFGFQGASPGLMKLCADNGVALSFFTPQGRFISRIQGPVKGNVLLRKRQYELLNDDNWKLKLSSLFIYGKIFNSRVTLRRFVRDHPSSPNIKDIDLASQKLKRVCLSSLNATEVDFLRGFEGEAAATYFNVFNELILNKSREFKFDKRTRRPPTDPVNAMLSLGYSLLANDCASALEGTGLDPAAGFMHTLRPGRNSLALDLIEELRSYMVDRFVLSLINNRQISPSDFVMHNNVDDETSIPVYFTDSGLKKFLTAWQSKKRNEINHPFINEKIPLGLIPHIQSQLLARYIRNDIDNYPVFLAK